jgi:hypothetical protein
MLTILLLTQIVLGIMAIVIMVVVNNYKKNNIPFDRECGIENKECYSNYQNFCMRKHCDYQE